MFTVPDSDNISSCNIGKLSTLITIEKRPEKRPEKTKKRAA
jgi:hypothetical protein